MYDVLQKARGHAHIPNPVTPSASIVLILGMNLRITDEVKRFKFYVDVDYDETEVRLLSELTPILFALSGYDEAKIPDKQNMCKISTLSQVIWSFRGSASYYVTSVIPNCFKRIKM